MTAYDKQFKDKVVARMLMTDSPSIAMVSRETGVCEATLYRWRSEALRAPRPASGRRP